MVEVLHERRKSRTEICERENMARSSTLATVHCVRAAFLLLNARHSSTTTTLSRRHQRHHSSTFLIIAIGIYLMFARKVDSCD